MEIWDAYDINGHKLGVDLVRGADIPIGQYHIVVNVIVRHIDGMYLVTRRDWQKPACPGLWEAGASGSILKGESPREGAQRELFEETGIQSKNLTLIGYGVSSDTIYMGFLCLTDIEPDSIVLQPGETIDYRWLTKNDFIELAQSAEFMIPMALNTYIKSMQDRD